MSSFQETCNDRNLTHSMSISNLSCVKSCFVETDNIALKYWDFCFDAALKNEM